ncbi:EF hand family protein [Cyclospora cayetanensis]|uniref:ubiquitinyl hydrolase 1 n=1 Tax=Cyclospora cayetanensis TaxID=88456 RepID=A0A1D3D9E9_9EIME|nr:EF hand family protein [Cyclospora cayetanensis]
MRKPLEEIAEGPLLTFDAAGDDEEGLQGTLPFDLSLHPISGTAIGKNTIQRLKHEVAAHAKQQQEASQRLCLAGYRREEIADLLLSPSCLSSRVSDLSGLRQRLLQCFLRDGKFVERGIRLLQALATHVKGLDEAAPAEHRQQSHQDQQELLLAALKQQEEIDKNDLSRWRVRCMQWAYALGRAAGTEATVSFDSLVSLSMSANAGEVLLLLNPFLTPKMVRDILSLVGAVMLAVNRRSQICRCLQGIVELMQLLKTFSSRARVAVREGSQPKQHLEGGGRAVAAAPSVATSSEMQKLLSQAIPALHMKAQSVAEQISSERHYMQAVVAAPGDAAAVLEESGLPPSAVPPEGGTVPGASYDPRYLVFEFAYGLLLRQPQVALLRQFRDSVNAGRSLCHQMIMGSGKTTVVSPLLALLLADGKRLVVSVVPPALLHFSRASLRERFSAIFQKGVFVLSFARTDAVSAALYLKLLQTRDSRGIVITTPTAIKSFLLKALQLMHFLQAANAANPTKGTLAQSFLAAESLGASHLKKLQSQLSKFLRMPRTGSGTTLGELEDGFPSASPHTMTEQQLRSCRRELDMALRVLELFRAGVLIIDEVDEVLQPLKSELHWPLGQRQPLDFTARQGFSAFPAATGQTTIPCTGTAEMWRLLGLIRHALQQGIRQRALQQTPHLLLLSPVWYQDHLKPLLAQWLSLFFALKKLAGISHDQQQQYIMLPVHICPSNLTGSCFVEGEGTLYSDLFEAVERLPEVHLKTLNLAREWLCSLLPHALQKVNRVHYGLLTSEEIEDCLLLQAVPLPRSRQLLAVPFLGKDAPSPASEFSHPDMLIGLSILAYRYQGLRYEDFHRLLVDQLGRLEGGYGPVSTRPAAKEYGNWIWAAGGRVRGLHRRKRHAEEWIHDLRSLAAEAMPQQQPSHPLRMDADDPFRGLPGLREGGTDSKTETRQTSDSGLPSGAAAAETKFSEAEAAEGETFDKMYPLEMLSLSDREHLESLYTLIGKEPLAIAAFLFRRVMPSVLEHAPFQLSASGQEIGGDSLFTVRIGFSGTPSELLPCEMGKCCYEAGTDGKVLRLLSSPSVVSWELLPPEWSVASLLQLVAAPREPPFHALIDTGALISGISNYHVALVLLQLGLPHMEGVVFLDSRDRQMVLIREGWEVLQLAQCGIATERRFSFYDHVHTTGQDIRQAADGRAFLTLGKDCTFRDVAQGAFRMRGLGRGQTLHYLIPPGVAALIEGHARLVASSASNVWRKAALAVLKETHASLGTDAASVQTQNALGVFLEPVDFSVPPTVPFSLPLSLRIKQLAQQHAELLEATAASASPQGSFSISRGKALIDKLVRELEEEEAAARRHALKGDARDAEVSDALRMEGLEAEIEGEEQQQQEEEQQEMHTESADPLADFFGHAATEGDKIRASDRDMFSICSSGDSRTQLSKKQSDLLGLFETSASSNSQQRHNMEPMQPHSLLSASFSFPSSAQEPAAPRTVSSRQQPRMQREEELHFTLAELSAALGSAPFCAEQEGRFFVVLTLAEGEAVRAALHAQQRRQQQSLVPGHRVAVSLHNVSASFAMVDGSPFFRKDEERVATAVGVQQQTAHACLRFLNSCLLYSESHLLLLQGVLSQTPCRDRQEFFFSIRRCRRRQQNAAWEQLPVARLFSAADGGAQLLQHRAFVSRLRERLRRKRLLPAEAFRLFDVLNRGQLTEAQLVAGIKWLGLQLQQQHQRDICRRFDLDGDGFISLNDFLLTVGQIGGEVSAGPAARTADAAAAGIAAGLGAFNGTETAGATAGGIGPHSQHRQSFESGTATTTTDAAAAALSGDASAAEASQQSLLQQWGLKEALPGDLVSRLKFRLQPHAAFERIWTGRLPCTDTRSSSSSGSALFSIWGPKQMEAKHRGLMRRNRERVPLGYFICSGTDITKAQQQQALSAPAGAAAAGAGPLVLEATDSGASSMSESVELTRALSCLFPVPVKYKVLWRESISQAMLLLNPTEGPPLPGGPAGTPGGGAPLTLWAPVPPSPLFVALGIVATRGNEAPPPGAIRCVPAKWVRQAGSSIRLAEVSEGGAGARGRPRGPPSKLALWQVGGMALLGATLESPDGSLHRGGVTWGDFLSADFRLRPAAPPMSSGYRPPSLSSQGRLSGSPLDVLDSADAAVSDAQNPKLNMANALIPDISTKKSSIW